MNGEGSSTWSAVSALDQLCVRDSRVRGDTPQYSAACSVESISHMDLISLPVTGIKGYAIPSIVYYFAPQITFYRPTSLVDQIV